MGKKVNPPEPNAAAEAKKRDKDCLRKLQVEQVKLLQDIFF